MHNYKIITLWAVTQRGPVNFSTGDDITIIVRLLQFVKDNIAFTSSLFTHSLSL